MSRIKFLNTYVDNLNMQEAIDKIDFMIRNGNNQYIVTPNVDHIVKIEKDHEFKKIYEEANLILTDGMPLIWISKIVGTPIKEKVSGSDLFPKICELASKNAYKVFLLGAAEGVAEIAAQNLKRKFENLNIVGTYSPPLGFEQDDKEVEKIINIININNVDVLFIGLGAPKQEKFIYKYKDRLNIKLSLAVGASIDFEAGVQRRAPKWMQNNGLEWSYRLYKEPKRMYKRYIIDDFKIIKIVFSHRKKHAGYVNK